MLGTAKPKPPKGEFFLERKGKRQARVIEEQKTMRDAKKRDSGVCRFPMCKHRNLPIDCAHMVHRSLGGNPSGDRTQLPILVTLCRQHHHDFDACLVDIQPQDSALGANGPMDFFVRSESGRFELFASEKKIGVSTVRATK